MANGDITMTVPKAVPNVQFADVTIQQLPVTQVSVTFLESGNGQAHVVRLTDASAQGFSYNAGVFTDGVPVAILNEMTKIIGILLGPGAASVAARKTAAIQALVTDGVIVIAGGSAVG